MLDGINYWDELRDSLCQMDSITSASSQTLIMHWNGRRVRSPRPPGPNPFSGRNLRPERLGSQPPDLAFLLQRRDPALKRRRIEASALTLWGSITRSRLAGLAG